MNKRQIKAFEEAYDKLYDLNSAYGYHFEQSLNILEKEAKINGYEFYLKESSQKFKMRLIK